MFCINLLVLLLIQYFSFVRLEFSQESSELECIKLSECPSLNKLLIPENKDSFGLDLLRLSQCGFVGKEPKVWCIRSNNECLTPDSKQGWLYLFF